jgi:ATP-dependent RNA helicase RhlE
MQFSEIGLTKRTLRALDDEGYTQPTAIQALAIPHVLVGRDLIGCAQPGTGKTAAFALPILERLAVSERPEGKRTPRVVVLTPTCGLASRVGASFRVYGRYTGLSHAVVLDSANQQRQVSALARDIDVLVATPARLLELVEQQAVCLLDVSVLVLDEAEQLLDMGLQSEIARIAAMVHKRHQTLLFCGAISPEIRNIAPTLLSNPVEVTATPFASGSTTIDQRLYFVEKADKRRLLSWILEDRHTDRALVFTRTKHGSNRVVEQLKKTGIVAVALHADQPQSMRDEALGRFQSGAVRVLVTTDTAARGLDIGGSLLVVNYDLPNVPESYLQRIERTSREGSVGHAMSFCESEERSYLKNIERLIGMHIPVITEHPFPSPHGVPVATDLDAKRGARTSGPQHTRPRA